MLGDIPQNLNLFDIQRIMTFSIKLLSCKQLKSINTLQTAFQ